MEDKNVKPSAHLEGKFKVVGVVPGPVKTKSFGVVDLRFITLNVAEKLHEKGFPYLEKIVAKTASATATK